MTIVYFPFINKAMAIRRCPYCKAIIDERAKFCSNCGTQLLFPEDEFIEEPIPGEKIVEEEERKEEEDKEIELEEEEEVLEEEEEQAVEERGEINLEEEYAEERNEEEPEEEVKLEDGGKNRDKEKIFSLIEKEESKLISHVEKHEENFLLEDEKRTYHEEEKKETEPEKELEEELAFKAEDLEKALETSEFEKDEIEKFLASVKQEREKQISNLEDVLSPPVQEKQSPSSPIDDIPPWASKIRDVSMDELSISPAEEESEGYFEDETRLKEGETKIEKGKSKPDSGVGVPEEIFQKSLPFEGEKEEAHNHKGRRIKISSRFSQWLKSRIFDLLFIAAFWVISLWLASRVMEVNLFNLIAATSLSIIIFYFILLSVYFFLFRFFLGETLGDHLFAQED